MMMMFSPLTIFLVLFPLVLSIISRPLNGFNPDLAGAYDMSVGEYYSISIPTATVHFHLYINTSVAITDPSHYFKVLGSDGVTELQGVMVTGSQQKVYYVQSNLQPGSSIRIEIQALPSGATIATVEYYGELISTDYRERTYGKNECETDGDWNDIDLDDTRTINNAIIEVSGSQTVRISGSLDTDEWSQGIPPEYPMVLVIPGRHSFDSTKPSDMKDGKFGGATIDWDGNVDGVITVKFICNNRQVTDEYDLEYHPQNCQGLSGGAITGIVIGCVAGVALITFLVLFFLNKLPCCKRGGATAGSGSKKRHQHNAAYDYDLGGEASLRDVGY